MSSWINNKDNELKTEVEQVKILQLLGLIQQLSNKCNNSSLKSNIRCNNLHQKLNIINTKSNEVMPVIKYWMQ